MCDVAQGLTYLHSARPNPILHRDLKSLNILVDENWRGKVADFGMTRFQEDGATMTQCGSPLWMAPEMIRNLAYDEKSDVYSFGICLWEVYTRAIPYRNLGLSPSNLVVKVVKDHLRPPIPPSAPRPYQKLMERCWHPSPERRPSFRQILRVLESFLEDPVMKAAVAGGSSRQSILAPKPLPAPAPSLADVQEAVRAGWKIENWEKEVQLDNITANDRETMIKQTREENERMLRLPIQQSQFNPGSSSSSSSSSSPDLNGYSPTITPNSPAFFNGTLRPSREAGEENSLMPPDTRKIGRAGSGLDGKGGGDSIFNYLSNSQRGMSGRRMSVSTATTVASTTGSLASINTEVITPSKLVRKDQPEHPSDAAFAMYRGKQVIVRRLIVHEDPSISANSSGAGGGNEGGSQQNMYSNLGALRRMRKIRSNPTLLTKLHGIVQELGDLRHPNLALFMGAYTTDEYVGLVFEHMQQGNLRSLVRDHSVILEWDTVISMATDIAHALTYLHSCKPPIIPPELDSASALVDSNWRVKLINTTFGTLDQRLYGRPLPPTPWTAPETLERPGTVTVASNVYSFGVIIWELFARKAVYDGVWDARHLRAVARDGLRPKIPSSMPPEFVSLLAACWALDPAQRPSLNDILQVLQKAKEQGPPRTTLVLGNNAERYRKRTTIYAYRSADPITFLKDWGKSHGSAGCYVVLSKDDDVYALDAEVFNRSYEPVQGRPHEYRKTGCVLARRMEEPFAVRTKAQTTERGVAGDYLVQNALGEQWTIDGRTFLELYEPDVPVMIAEEEEEEDHACKDEGCDEKECSHSRSHSDGPSSEIVIGGASDTYERKGERLSITVAPANHVNRSMSSSSSSAAREGSPHESEGKVRGRESAGRGGGSRSNRPPHELEMSRFPPAPAVPPQDNGL